MNAARRVLTANRYRPGIVRALLTMLWLWLGATTVAQAGNISGSVTNGTANPLSGISVDAFTGAPGGGGWQWIANASTALNGSYTIAGLAAGNYRVCFSDYLRGVYAFECYNDAVSQDTGVDVPVTATGSTAGIEAQLAVAGHFTGHLTNAAGVALSGIQVNAQSWNSIANYWQWAGGTTATITGSYDLGVRAGAYRVCFSDNNSVYAPECYDNASNVNGATDLSVAAGSIVPNINAQLALAGHVTGTVTYAANPVAGITVQAQAWNAGNHSWDWIGNVFTAADGTYNLALGAGTYKICFGNGNGSGLYAFQCYNNAANQNDALDVVVVAGQPVPNINAQLVRAAHITGTVSNPAGGPAPGIQVQAQTWNASGSYWQWAGNTTSGPAGTYDLGGLVAGTYQVCFYGWNPFVQQCNTGTTGVYLTTVTLAAGQIRTGINAVAVDAPPPGVSSLQPVDDASGVPVDQPIIVMFDRSMDTSPLYFRIDLSERLGGGPNLPGQATWSQTTYPNDTLTFLPDSPLRYSMSYDLMFQCRDTNGIGIDGYNQGVSTQFSTVGAPGDTSPPRTIFTTPYPGQRGGDTTRIRIGFDKPIDAATINPLSVVLTGTSVPPYLLRSRGFELDIWPQGLRAQSQYQLALTSTVADAEGHPLAPYTFGFNSGAGDTVAPTVVQTLVRAPAPPRMDVQKVLVLGS